MSAPCLDDTIAARQMSINGSLTMHLNQIKSFITVSQVLNFTNAARQNGVPQSTISRQINDLEQQLGVKLFYRTKRDVRLTQEEAVRFYHMRRRSWMPRKKAPSPSDSCMRVQRDGFLSLQSMIPISFWPCVCKNFPGNIPGLS